MKLLAVALCGCCLLLGATTEARRPMRGRQLRRNDASSSSSSDVLPWDPQNSVNSPIEPVPAAQTIEGRQYYGGGGGYPGQGGQGGYPGQGGQGGYPGQGGQGGYPGQGGSGGSGGTGGGSGSGGGGGSGGGSGSGGGGGSGGSGGDNSNEIPEPPAGSKPGKPQRPPGCLKDRGQFPSPKSCSHYINCWDDVAIEQLCPNGLLFNEKRQYCDFDYNVKCGNRPKPTPRPPMDGSKRCPELNGIHRNAKNCSEFFVCVAGVPNKFQCPRGLVFSEETQVCDYPNKVDCKGAWTPKPLPPTTETPRPGGGGSGGGNGGGSGGGGGGGGYPGQPQPENPNPNPPYDPDRPELPGPLNPYNTNNFLRAKPEFWQQRQAVLHSELEQDIQAQKEAAELEEDSDSSTIQNPWEVSHTIPQEFAKVPCENGEVHRLTEACTSVVVCRSRRPQLINCQTGYAYDKPTDSCRPLSIAQC